MSWVWFFVVGIGLVCVFQFIAFLLYIGRLEQRFNSINEANNVRSMRLQLLEKRVDQLAARVPPSQTLSPEELSDLERRIFPNRYRKGEQQGDDNE